ncbi:hypothetical protein [Arcanobacterium hippocoleae]|uniref:hypothetical protein n=1 Tax=Arcanobacterium hippocoleae TaxID=149017 RepID=UPI003340DE25
MELNYPEVLFLTGAPGTGIAEVGIAFENSGIQVADFTSLVESYDRDANLQTAIELNSYTQFDQAGTAVLDLLFTDISAQQARASQTEVKPHFVILLPTIAFLLRLCPLTAQMIATQLSRNNVRLAVLQENLSQMIIDNHLFGNRNNVILPRRILRSQLAEFTFAVSNFSPMVIDVSIPQTKMEIVTQIIAEY